MKFAISDQIRSVHFPPITEVRGWLASRQPDPTRPLIDLCQAVPDYAPARQLTDYLAACLDDPAMAKYSPDEGLLEVREAVCGRYGRVYGAAPTPEGLCLTIGASQAFWLAMVTLCRAGDEVIVPLPAYFDHPMALEMLGIRPVWLPFDTERGGVVDPAAVERLITPRTRAILLVTPSNPTGVVTPPDVIHELYSLARRRGIALVLDETYADFIPGDTPPHDLFADPHWGDHFVQIMSFGKTYALTGYRAGCLVASDAFIHHALKAQDTMAVCQPRITQHAVMYGARHLDDWVAENRLMMERRHDLFRSAFTRPGNPFSLAASGTFFAWVRHPFPGRTGREVARRLAVEAGVICLPGEVFGPGLEPYLRIAFGNIREEVIPEAVARFRSLTR
ncbi:aminotransferase [Geobacter sp.]|uniref:aminotransferase n=1 Tax=Geobacter sp. TaxID=46610 RepID=UPI001AD325C5|nr:aminotransferase [Geobacter sp.]CAG0959782.1 aminotransferase [Geobacteraceae bacterium]